MYIEEYIEGFLFVKEIQNKQNYVPMHALRCKKYSLIEFEVWHSESGVMRIKSMSFFIFVPKARIFVFPVYF